MWPVSIGIPQTAERSTWLFVDGAAAVGNGKLAVPAFSWVQTTANNWEYASAVLVTDTVTGEKGTVELDGALAGELVVDGDSVWVSHEENAGDVNGQPVSKYYADRLDLTSVTAPVIAARVNIPGQLVGVNGATIFTRDYAWTPDGLLESALAELTVDGEVAVLRSYLKIDGYLGRVVVREGRIFGTTQATTYDMANPGNLLRVWSSTESQPLAETFAMPLGGWMQVRDARAGHLFLGTGYYGSPWGWGGGRATGGADVAVSDAGMRGGYYGTDGLFDYSLADADAPEFRQFVLTNGWVQGLDVQDDTLFVSSGIFGVQTVTLEP